MPIMRRLYTKTSKNGEAQYVSWEALLRIQFLGSSQKMKINEDNLTKFKIETKPMQGWLIARLQRELYLNVGHNANTL